MAYVRLYSVKPSNKVFELLRMLRTEAQFHLDLTVHMSNDFRTRSVIFIEEDPLLFEL